MKNKKILLCLIPMLMTACAEPSHESVEYSLMPATFIENQDNITTEYEERISDEYEVDENTTFTDSVNPELCTIHKAYYHSYPRDLIEYIGDEFYDWVHMEESKSDSDLTDDCPYSHCNIIECLEYFDITKEEFSELYYTSLYYFYPYDPDVMYSGNMVEIQNLFKDDMTEDLEFENKRKLGLAKAYLRAELSEMSVNEQIIDKYQQLPMTAWTFSDIISEAQISQDTFETFLSEHRSFSDAFDVDAIYAQVEAMEEVTSAEMNTAATEETLLEKCLDNIAYEMQFLADE